jgi:hypothetical protein
MACCDVHPGVPFKSVIAPHLTTPHHQRPDVCLCVAVVAIVAVWLPCSRTPNLYFFQPVAAVLQGIIANGMGYESNGSVYFDTAKFRWAHPKTSGLWNDMCVCGGGGEMGGGGWTGLTV